MKYKNGRDIFPTELLEIIQDYTQGNYIYIPKRNEDKERWGSQTTYMNELAKRNSHIFSDHLSGYSMDKIADRYCLSPKSIRRIISQNRKGAQKMKEKIEELLKQWNIEADVKQIYQTTWEVGTDYVLKTGEDFGNLKRNITMLKVLHESGIPVPLPITTAGGNDYVECDGRYFLMMNKLKGSHVLDIYECDYGKVSYETGRITARLHTAFLACEQKVTFWNNSLLEEMKGWIFDTFKSKGFRYITEGDFEACLLELQNCYDKLPRQLIHRDLHYGNLLFDQGIFSGYVDFDLSQKNIRMFDLCYFLMGLLVEHVNDKEKVQKWYVIVSNFIKGYESLNLLTSDEKDSICCIMCSIEVLFVAYFLSQEDETLAKSAADMFYFVRKNESDIKNSIHHSHSH